MVGVYFPLLMFSIDFDFLLYIFVFAVLFIIILLCVFWLPHIVFGMNLVMSR